jgi:hypothetical protein
MTGRRVASKNCAQYLTTSLSSALIPHRSWIWEVFITGKDMAKPKYNSVKM